MAAWRGTAGVIVLLVALAWAPGASAKKVADPGNATISSCGGDSLRVAAVVRGSKKARGARLQLEFDLVPLFGELRRSSWIDVGRVTKVSRSQRFKGLPANAWIGAVRYRFMKGSKVVEQGSLRSKSGKVGKASGRGVCTLPIGLIPHDVLAPFVIADPSKDDGIWHRAPFTVNFIAVDDFSGVASVDYRVNGAPGSGRSVTLSQDGTFGIDYSAIDVAGNRSAALATTVHVDASAPTAPSVTAPTGASSDNTPTISWSASSDAASGVRGYIVIIRDSGGNIVTAPVVGADTTSITSPKLANGSYTAQIVAFDGASPQVFAAASDVQGFTVNDVVYSNDFSGTGCNDFTTGGGSLQLPWACSTSLSTPGSSRLCSELNDTETTKSATSRSLSYSPPPTGEPMQLSFSRSFQTQNDPPVGPGLDADHTDAGLIELFVPASSGTAIRSKPFTGSVPTGSDTLPSFTQPAGASDFRVKTTLTLDNSTIGGTCVTSPASTMSVDDLALRRDP